MKVRTLQELDAFAEIARERMSREAPRLAYVDIDATERLVVTESTEGGYVAIVIEDLAYGAWRARHDEGLTVGHDRLEALVVALQAMRKPTKELAIPKALGDALCMHPLRPSTRLFFIRGWEVLERELGFALSEKDWRDLLASHERAVDYVRLKAIERLKRTPEEKR